MTFRLRAIRLILTSLILFLITWYYQVPERAWGLMTIWFVMFEYTNVGGVMIKSLYRFLGTFMSAAYGLFIIYFFANNAVINMLAFIPAVVIYIYYFMDTEKAYIAVIGCVTLSIVLLNHNDIDAAILRTFNVLLGILISMFMMRFFYPQYAKDEIMIAQSHFIKIFKDMIEDSLMDTLSYAQFQEKISQYEIDMQKALVAFGKYLKEASVETKQLPAFIQHQNIAIQHVRRLFRQLSVFMHDVMTPELRSNPEIQYELRQLLSMLMRMDESSIDVTFPLSHFLLEQIRKEMLLLKQETIHIMVLYRGLA